MKTTHPSLAVMHIAPMFHWQLRSSLFSKTLNASGFSKIILPRNITVKTLLQAALRPKIWLKCSTVFSHSSVSKFLITLVLMIGIHWTYKPGVLRWWSQGNGVQSDHLQLSSWVILILSLSLMKMWWHKKSFCCKLLWPPPHACSAESERRIGGEKSMCC